MMSLRARYLLRDLCLAAATAFAGCSDPPTGVTVLPSTLHDVAVSRGVANVLSAVLTARTEHVDSVAVRYGPSEAMLDSITPAVVPVSGEVAAPVLGLRPTTT
jgi:hypothetical protein